MRDDDNSKEMPSRAVGWRFIGIVLKDGEEVEDELGDFASYTLGKEAANKWMKGTKDVVKWVGYPFYLPELGYD